jgi:hypothetical protein
MIAIKRRCFGRYYSVVTLNYAILERITNRHVLAVLKWDQKGQLSWKGFSQVPSRVCNATLVARLLLLTRVSRVRSHYRTRVYSLTLLTNWCVHIIELVFIL